MICNRCYNEILNAGYTVALPPDDDDGMPINVKYCDECYEDSVRKDRVFIDLEDLSYDLRLEADIIEELADRAMDDYE